jgi:Omp85 superfamily domain
MSALAAALLAVTASAPWPRQVDAVEIDGNRWTHRRVMLRELPFAVPGEVTEEELALFRTRLWNMGIFSDVETSLEERDGKTVAVVRVDERVTLNPLFGFGVGGGAWWLRLGATDSNFLGTFLEWGARYERFDIFNGAQAWVRDPRLFGLRVSGLAEFDYLIRPRPQYVRRRLTGILDVSGELSDDARLSGRAEFFSDQYFAPKEGEAVVPRDLIGGTGTFGVTLGRVDLTRINHQGWTLSTRATLAFTDDPASRVVGQLLLELVLFEHFAKVWTFCVRGQAGLSTPAPPELQYYLGGLDLVRGYQDSVVRTHAYALVNLELRLNILEFDWFALVAAVFTDAAVAQQEGLTPLWSVGAGVRLLVPRFIKTGVRADFALTLAGQVAPGISLGVYQFF